MITGQLKSKVDKLWEAFWSGGITNSLTVIEQITYLMFANRIDELHTAREKKANLLGKPIEDPIFSDDQQHLRWSRFKDEEPNIMYERFRDEVFPFLKNLHGERDTPLTKFMKDAVFVMPTPALLDRAVAMIDDIPMDDRDTKGDVYEYMLGKLAVEGRNGQFRTPRHIIKMMVDLVQPNRNDIINDPACGTCGFLIACSEYLREHDSKLFHDEEAKKHFNEGMFHGEDFDSSMLRIGVMNLASHGIEHPGIRGVDSLSQANADVRDKYTLVMANPPFKGSLDYEEVAKDLLQETKTKKTELLFIALFLHQLQTGGRCACIVPDGVLFGSSKAHQAIRKTLVEDHKLDCVISMPSGVFKPYAGVSTAVLIFTRTDSGGTDDVFFYDMHADGYSLDDKRGKIDDDDIPKIIEAWNEWKEGKLDLSDRKAQAFTVPKEEIAENKYDLSVNRYKEIEYEEIEYDPPTRIIQKLQVLENEITKELDSLNELIK